MPHDNHAVAALIEKNHAAILSGWLAALKRSGKTHDSRAESAIVEQGRQFQNTAHIRYIRRIPTVLWRLTRTWHPVARWVFNLE